MEKTRKIRKVIRSRPTLEGAGVHLKRAFGFSEVPAFDPFLLLDDFRSNDPSHYLKGFPWHPHRGIETVTYVLEGSVEHGDSMGNQGITGPGDIQWMTAGSGIIHQEMPKGDTTGAMGGFQLWVNLPASHKMTKPRYRGVQANQIPELSSGNGAVIKVLCGEVKGTKGPVADLLADPEYLDISVSPHTEFIHSTKKTRSVFAYVIEGKACFCHEKNPFEYTVEGSNYFDLRRDALLANETLILFTVGERVAVSTEDDPVRFLLVSGKPLQEPVAWYGPIVMNTRRELQTAFEELDNGTFIQSTTDKSAAP